MMSKSHNGLEKPIHVMLITEGTYPFYQGGVSTWCHLLIRDLPEIDFTLLSLVGDPRVELQFVLPANIVEFRPVPLWGIREVLEARRELTLTEIRQRKQVTTDAVIESEFIPGFRAFLIELFNEESDAVRLGWYIHQMYRFFLAYDFDATLRSQVAWECFAQVARRYFPRTALLHGYPRAEFTLGDITDGMRFLYRWLTPLATELPRTDIVHTAAAGLCSLVAVAAKLEHGAAFLLTEHGIYLRERYLAEVDSPSSLFLKLFSLRFARRISELSYALADQISPGSYYNQRWELRNGAAPEKLLTIYNGVDPAAFTPAGKPVGEPPVVVWVGRITPLKDLVTLIRAAALVHAARPDIQFRVYGTAPAGDESYYQACLNLRTELGLEETVVFGGYAPSAEAAFNEGDVVVLSSISEGFPFSVVEAMLCGKPVVGTAVGGVPEAIEGCGIAVEPRHPEEMAQAILSLMNDPERCAALGRAAREKAMREFNQRQCGVAHRASYARLVQQAEMLRAQLLQGETLLTPPEPATVATEQLAEEAASASQIDFSQMGRRRLSSLGRQLPVPRMPRLNLSHRSATSAHLGPPGGPVPRMPRLNLSHRNGVSNIRSSRLRALPES